MTSTPTKESLYKTARTVKDLPGIEIGEYVAIVRYHEYNGTYTIRSISGVLQCFVSATTLDSFCL